MEKKNGEHKSLCHKRHVFVKERWLRKLNYKFNGSVDIQ